MNARNYVLLGSPHSALTDFARFILQQGMEREQPAVLFIDEAHRNAFDEDTLDPGSDQRFWRSSEMPPALADDAADTVFLPASLKDPRPFLENLHTWLEQHDRELGRIFTIIDCKALSEQPSLHDYYDLCLHFTDVVLLGNREDVSKKWVQQLQERIHKRAIPAHLAFLKKGGRVEDIAALLFPEARRLSQFFDPDETATLPGLEIEGFTDDEEEEADPRDPQEDPYLARGEDGQYRVRLKPDHHD